MKNVIARLTAAVIVALALLARPSPQAVHATHGPRCYVNGSASGAHDGDSWETAYVQVYEALEDSYCLEIWVAQGVYKPNPAGGQDSSFLLYDPVKVYGGFAGGESSLSHRDARAHLTILSGDLDGNDTNTDLNNIDEMVNDIQGANAHHVVMADGTAPDIISDTVLDSFTITGGDNPNGSGAGMSCLGNGNGSYCNAGLHNLVFIGNRAEGGLGGALYLDGRDSGETSTWLTNVLFKNNRAQYGGALYNNGSGGSSNPTLTDVSFEGNVATSYGGAMYNNGPTGDSSPTIMRATFSSNSAVGRGGAMYNNGSSGYASPMLANVTFHGNSTNTEAGWGGAMYSESTTGQSAPTLYNVTFVGNSAGYGGAIANQSIGPGGTTRPLLHNVILWGNTAGTSNQIHDANANAWVRMGWSVVQDGCAPIAFADCLDGGILTTDPLLYPLTDNGGLVKTMALTAGSPAIGAANDEVCGTYFVGSVDARGVARPQGTHCDIGAYEYTHFFSDLPVAGKEWMEPWVDEFYLKGITTGCGVSPLTYCPENPVTRAAMAVFILRAIEGPSYTPPAVHHYFNDLPVAGKEWMEPFVDEFYDRGITTGCGTSPLRYCPENPVTRAAMAVFLLRALEGSAYAPGHTHHYFSDLPVTGKEWMESYVDEFYDRGITTGCGTSPLRYCPENPVTRAAMAVFISRAYHLYP